MIERQQHFDGFKPMENASQRMLVGGIRVIIRYDAAHIRGEATSAMDGLTSNVSDSSSRSASR